MKIFAVFASFIAVASAAQCQSGYWKIDENSACNYACSPGCPPVEGASSCNEIGGACASTEKCNDGWQSAEGENKCDRPVCDFARNAGQKGCANGGKCIAPNTCICGQSGAQIVAKTVFDAEGNEDGTDCVSLRKDGIIGAFIALVVMSISISFCGLTERHLTKKKAAAKAQ